MKNLKCLQCSTNMRYIATENIQLGKTSWISGDIPNLIAGALEVDIYTCPNCGKVEFYQSEKQSSDGIAQTKCPACGKTHDIDCPKCPFCKHNYID